MAAAGIFYPTSTAGQALTGSTARLAASSPMAANTNSASSASSSTDSMVSANDFMTLLVTEMKNQDPTAQTDPNEYVNQLVQVNSLEQLITINETLQTDLGGTTSTTAKKSSASAESADAVTKATASAAQATAAARSATTSGASAASSLAAGNLSIPAANPAAERVAQALSGKQSSAASLKSIAGVR